MYTAPLIITRALGALYLNQQKGGVSVISNNTFLMNWARGTGGAIFVENNCDIGMQVLNNSFMVNSARKGGAVYTGLALVNFSIQDCSFINNHAYESGGAYYVQQDHQNIMIISSLFVNNTAEKDGGAIYVESNNTKFLLLDSRLEGNVANRGGGMYSFYSTDYLTVAGTEFTNNVAVTSGGGVFLNKDHRSTVIMNSDSYMDYKVYESSHPYISTAVQPYSNVLYSSNYTAADVDGLVLIFDILTALWTSDSFVIYKDYTMQKVLFANTGPNGWPGVDLPPLKVITTSLYIVIYGPISSLVISTGFYGFKVSIIPFKNEINQSTRSIFDGNSAGSGGGAGLFYFQSSSVFLTDTIFKRNSARNGGALYFDSITSGILFQSIEFVGNTAVSDGGGLYYQTANYGIGLSNVLFASNTAGMSGGSIFMASNNGNGLFLKDNMVDIKNCSFRNNAAKNGGAAYFFFANSVVIEETEFLYNTADDQGGALLFFEANAATMDSCQVVGNSAGSGGGLSSLDENSLVFSDVDIFNNTAVGMGGGVQLRNGTDLECINEVNIEFNEASYGGGLLIQSSSIFKASQGRVTFLSNRARKGSAIALADPLPSADRQFENINFVNNSALLAGTVYWMHSPSNSLEPPGLQSPTLTWMGNSAPYGEKTATQAVSIRTSDYEVNVYRAALTPSFAVTLVDFYGSTLVSDNATIVVMSLTQENARCAPKMGYLSGSTYVPSNVGIATFSSLFASCFPEGNMTIDVQAMIIEPFVFGLFNPPSYYPKTACNFHFRTCVAGEIIKDGACSLCALGTYLLIFDKDVERCDPCPAEADRCEGNEISLKAGYWRRTEVSYAVLGKLCELQR